MIKDNELLRNTELLFSKKLIIWGCGLKGKELAEKLSVHNLRIEFVDSDERKQEFYHGLPVYSPEKLAQYSMDNLAIILSPDAPAIQEGILKQIAIMGHQDIDIYTRFAVEGALCLVKNSEIKSKQKNLEIDFKTNVTEGNDTIRVLNAKVQLLHQILRADMSEKSVYVYQPKKVGSVSLVQSAKAVGVAGVHVHTFSYCFDGEEDFVRNMIRKSSGKVITIVREPIARQISLMWHSWGNNAEALFQKCHSLEELEHKFYSSDNENEFQWYKDEFEKVLGINIYNYPFDRDLGYTIIEKNGIQVLLLKLEKMNMLQKEIGDFLEVEDFKLINRNVAQHKTYCYAYQNYLEHVEIPVQLWEYYYRGNKYMDYFYSEKEKELFYKQWKEHMKEKKERNLRE